MEIEENGKNMLNQNSSQTEKLMDILQVFKEVGILNNMILVGSWAEYFYQDILKGFEVNMRTHDVDFLYRKVKPIKVTANVSEELKKKGYLERKDFLTAKTTFVGEELEIEFLAKLNRNHDSVETIKELGIGAECIGGLEIIEFNTLEHYCEELGTSLLLPTPSSYVIHKMIINADRKENKQQKDALSIIGLFPYIQASKDGRKDFQKILSSLSKKQMKKVKLTAQKIGIDLKNIQAEKIINNSEKGANETKENLDINNIKKRIQEKKDRYLLNKKTVVVRSKKGIDR